MTGVSILSALLPILLLLSNEPLTLDTLRSGPEMEVTLEGSSLLSYPSKRPCVYFEWTYGTLEKGAFTSRWSGYSSEEHLIVVTPLGRIEVSPRSLRPYLAPSFEHTYGPKEKGRAPGAVAEALEREGGPLTVREYRLERGRTYHAKVAVETYLLPPEPGGDRPGHGENAVLWISDLSLKDGKPQRPITPTFEHWSY